MKMAKLLRSVPPPPSPPSRDDPARAPWGVFDIVAAVLITIAALAVISLVRAVVLSAAGIPQARAEQEAGGVASAVVGQILIDLCAVGAAALMSVVKYHVSLRSWGLRREQPVAWGASTAVLIASFVVLFAYSTLVRAIGLEHLQPREDVPRSLFDFRSVVPLTVLLIVVIAPFAEEAFFRGFIFNGLRRPLGLHGAAIVSGVLFAAIHLSNGDPAQLVGLLVPFTIIGYMFAVLDARTGSLWNSIVVHAVFNAIGVAGLLGSR
jgi:membrane protease YdiL (CAAX protease family)